jgi:predicted transcriptional regulator
MNYTIDLKDISTYQIIMGFTKNTGHSVSEYIDLFKKSNIYFHLEKTDGTKELGMVSAKYVNYTDGKFYFSYRLRPINQKLITKGNHIGKIIVKIICSQQRKLFKKPQIVFPMVAGESVDIEII